MVRIVLVSVGTRGDVQPYCLLGKLLAARGHQVTVASEERLQPLVASFGLAYSRIEGDYGGLALEPSVQKAARDGSLLTLLRLQTDWEKRWPRAAVLASYVAALSSAVRLRGD